MKHLIILSYVVILSVFFLLMFHHDKPNPRIAESDAYYKKLDAQVAAFPNDLATGKLDSQMLADTNYYLIKGGISAGKYVWDMSNRLRHLLDSIYKIRKENTASSVLIQSLTVHQVEGGFGPSPLPFKTKQMPISMGAAPLHFDTSFDRSEYGECALCETPKEQIDDLSEKVTKLQHRVDSLITTIKKQNKMLYSDPDKFGIPHVDDKDPSNPIMVIPADTTKNHNQ